jgi:hypothetical protein
MMRGSKVRAAKTKLLWLVAGLVPIWGQANEFKDAALMLTDAHLEASFWQCDFRATRGTLPLALAPGCQAITDELKRRQFGDDFDRLLSWWQQHKAAQHAQLEAEGQAAVRGDQPVGL